MLRFLVDAQLPPALARKLIAAGHDATHVLDVGLLDASDSKIWDYALANQYTIVTKDEDFAIRASVSKLAPQIIWIRTGNTSNAKLLDGLERELPLIIAEIEKGSRLVEIRR